MNGMSKMEVKALSKLMEWKTITDLANELGLSIYRTSILVASLERKGLVKTKKGKVQDSLAK